MDFYGFLGVSGWFLDLGMGLIVLLHLSLIPASPRSHWRQPPGGMKCRCGTGATSRCFFGGPKSLDNEGIDGLHHWLFFLLARNELLFSYLRNKGTTVILWFTMMFHVQSKEHQVSILRSLRFYRLIDTESSTSQITVKVVWWEDQWILADFLWGNIPLEDCTWTCGVPSLLSANDAVTAAALLEVSARQEAERTRLLGSSEAQWTWKMLHSFGELFSSQWFQDLSRSLISLYFIEYFIKTSSIFVKVPER